MASRTAFQAGVQLRRLELSFFGFPPVCIGSGYGLNYSDIPLSSVSWIGTMTILVLDWRSGSHLRRDPNFNPPSVMRAHEDDYDDDDESRYDHTPSNAPQLPPLRRGAADEVSSPFSDTHQYRPDEPRSRPSIDTYGAFSDPPPSGFDAAPASPGVSRTMQYADPYAAVRANIGNVSPKPPSYEYSGTFESFHTDCSHVGKLTELYS